MSKISVVILNWNGSEMLFRFLPSVLHWSTMPDVEICVADNGSTDQSVQMLHEYFPSVRVIILGENFGFAGGYNRALKQIESDYVVLLNSDVEVTENWLEPVVDYLDAHPEIAACQPKILNYSQKDSFEYAGAAGGFIDRYGYPFCRGRIMGITEKDKGQYNTIIPVFWASGAAFFIRLKDYRAVEGLDEIFFAHMEEIDICWRLRARGREIVCIPQSKVYHVGANTLKKEDPHKTFLNFRNNLLMLYKNLPEKEFERVMCTRIILDYLAAFSFLCKGQLPNAIAVIRARREYRTIRPFLLSIRKENLKETLHSYIPERIDKSILVWFYIKGRKFFSQLPFDFLPFSHN
ncbi:MAG: glycosyltransferase family 2 protein [Mediterranea sp.]|jgi:GT2 family glycosyltransferase|nr:glycosyltransferase family 2 protein [Mediterranea sp.]